jgi:hypothetical protein
MWEARAAEGCGERLLAWVLDALRARKDEQGSPGAGNGAGEGHTRAEVYRSEVYRSRSQDAELVVVILHVPPGAGEVTPGAVLPAPPAALLARPPQAWDFDPVALTGGLGS